MQVPAGLVRRGHFAFAADFHGDTWLDLDALLADATCLRGYADGLALMLAAYSPDTVCGPLDGGAFVAQFVAARIGASFAYNSSDNSFGTIRGADVFDRGDVVVDDAINAGTAVRATVAALRTAGARVLAIGSLITCLPDGGRVGDALGVPQHHLLGIDTELWTAADCPQCAAGIPVETA
ncbi:MAG: hypothetical protein ABI912_06715 [Actinomycetota bacterium]